MQSKTEKEERVCVCVGQTEEEGDDTHTPEREGVLFKSLFGHFRGKKRNENQKFFSSLELFIFPFSCHWQPSDSLDDSTR
jgi:hypothetical protein